MDIKLSGNVIIRHQSVPECQWCDKAKEFFEEKGLKYTVINSDKRFFGEVMKNTKSTAVPQILIKGEFVGDYPGVTGTDRVARWCGLSERLDCCYAVAWPASTDQLGEARDSRRDQRWAGLDHQGRCGGLPKKGHQLFRQRSCGEEGHRRGAH